MKSLHKQSLFFGSILMALAVGLGAFGAHGLKTILSPQDLEIYKTGNFYHMIHAVGILVCSAILHAREKRNLRWVVNFLYFGILLFSGSLYLLSVSTYLFGERLDILGIITPLGGLSFIIAWLLLAVSARKKHKEKEVKNKEE